MAACLMFVVGAIVTVFLVCVELRNQNRRNHYQWIVRTAYSEKVKQAIRQGRTIPKKPGILA